MWHRVLLQREPQPGPHLPVHGGCVALPLPALVSLSVHGGVGKLPQSPIERNVAGVMVGGGSGDWWPQNGYMCMRVYVCACVHVWVRVCMHVSVCVPVYTYGCV